MTLIWHLYWPLFLAALLIGLITGRYGFLRAKLDEDASEQARAAEARRYRSRRRRILPAGLALLLGIVAVWHGPMGGADRFATTAEGLAQRELQWLELPEIQARLDRSPLRRTLLLTGPANDFVQAELARVLTTTPGVSRARWGHQPAAALPLLAEVALLSLVPFLLGLFLAYLVEVRRRVNAEWSW